MNERQMRWDRRYLSLAALVATWSKDPSTKVGAVLVRSNNSVASTGFNGFPPGHDDSPELYATRAYKYKYIIHAEINALTFCDGQPLRGATLYTSFPTCPGCMGAAGRYGIARVVHPPLEACAAGKSEAWLEEWSERLEQSRSIAAAFGIQVGRICV